MSIPLPRTTIAHLCRLASGSLLLDIMELRRHQSQQKKGQTCGGSKFPKPHSYTRTADLTLGAAAACVNCHSENIIQNGCKI